MKFRLYLFLFDSETGIQVLYESHQVCPLKSPDSYFIFSRSLFIFSI